MIATRSVAEDFGVPVHLDGSRIFNAATYLNVQASELAKDADSVQFCLSKGLGAPMGSILAGSTELVEEARHLRQMIGGQTRQLGLIAAAGIVALEKMTLRLHEDHENAQILAEGLAGIRGMQIDPQNVQTNLVFCDVELGYGTAESAISELRDRGVLAWPAGVNPQTIRFALHCDIARKDVADALAIISSVMEKSPAV
jgi:threonine aldolase